MRTIHKRCIAALTVCLAVNTLAACGTKTEGGRGTDTTITAATCEQIDPIEASQTKLYEATRVKFSSQYTADEGTEVRTSSTEMLRDEKKNISLRLTGQDPENLDVTGVTRNPDFVYVQFSDGIFEGLSSGQWVAFSQGSTEAAAFPLDVYMDEAIIGDEALGGGEQQLANSYDLTQFAAQEATVRGGDCVFVLDQGGASAQYEKVSITTDAKGRVTGVDIQLGDGQATVLEVGYAPVTVVMPEPAEIAPEEVSNAIIERLGKARVRTSAEMFDRQLRFVASSSSPDGRGDPRNPQFLFETIQAGGMPVYVTVSVKGADGGAVVVWKENQSLIADTTVLAKLIERIEISRDGRSACIVLPQNPADASNITQGGCW